LSESLFRAGGLIAAAIPALPTSYLLLRADQQIFGMSSTFLGGLVAVIGLTCVLIGAISLFRSRYLGS